MSYYATKEQLKKFWETDDFFLGVILHTRAVLSSGGERGHDWWSVDLFDGEPGHELVHRPTVVNRARGQHIPLYMISEQELAQLQVEAGSDEAEKLAAALRNHPEMLTDAKRLMREQLSSR